MEDFRSMARVTPAEVETLYGRLSREERDELLQCLLIAATRGGGAMTKVLEELLLCHAAEELIEGQGQAEGGAQALKGLSGAPMRIELKRVDELPPKKDGANSMWGKPSESDRLVALRRAVLEAPGYAGVYTGDVRLQLDIHFPAGDPRLLGDLDTFITGICDGLMAANPQAKHHGRWGEDDCVDISPECALLIGDDSQVVEIVARRFADAASAWYRLVIEAAE